MNKKPKIRNMRLVATEQEKSAILRWHPMDAQLRTADVLIFIKDIFGEYMNYFLLNHYKTNTRDYIYSILEPYGKLNEEAERSSFWLRFRAEDEDWYKIAKLFRVEKNAGLWRAQVILNHILLEG